MAIVRKEAYFNSSDAEHKIRTLIWQNDELTPIGIVQLAHGMAEHIERYDEFARFLANNSFIVCGNDHLGHGKSVNDRSELGFFAETNGNIRLVDDNSDKAPYYEPIVTLFEKRLTHLLWLRHGKNGSPEFNDEEKSQLRSIFSYANLTIENDDDAQARFTALMLICSYLMKDNKAVKEYTDKVNEYLKGITIPATETECYLMTALFIANHDPQVRSAAKAYRQSHPDCSPTICQLQSIAKNIRCR